jgi:hypothetical protein
MSRAGGKAFVSHYLPLRRCFHEALESYLPLTEVLVIDETRKLSLANPDQPMASMLLARSDQRFWFVLKTAILDRNLWNSFPLPRIQFQKEA